MTRKESAGRSRNQLRVDRWVQLPPDPSLPEILTKSEYPLPSAVAELVDNSIDSGARRIIIRLIRTAKKLESLQVLDDGCGIEPAIFDKIMRFGYKSPHKSTDIGMYGVGLKTSSLSQADKLWVVSRVRGKVAHGRELVKSDLAKQKLGVIRAVDAQVAFDSAASMTGSEFRSRAGTLVEWRNVKDFIRSEEGVEAYLKIAMLDLDAHLGLVFHRFLERKKCKIFIEVQQDALIVSSTDVRAINPFKYPKTGVRGWPKQMTLRIVRGQNKKPLLVNAVAHIWPPRTKVPEYKIRRVGGRTNTIDSQGIYFYLGDRLLIPGGWSNIRTPEAHLALARMEITLTPELQKIVEVVYTKDKAMVPQSFVRALRNATTSDGASYAQWIDLAQRTFRTPSKGHMKLPTLPLPGAGMPEELRSVVERAGFPKGKRVKLKWSNLSENHVFQVDRKRKVLLVNHSYRRKLSRVLGGQVGVELMISLLFHSLRDHFGDRNTARLSRIEELMNDTVREILR